MRYDVIIPKILKTRWSLYTLFFIAYLALDQASYIVPFPGFNVTPWNPHPALAVALLMFCGWNAIGAVYLTILAAELAFRFEATTLSSAAFTSAVLTFGYSAMAHALCGRWKIARSLRHRGDVVRMLTVITLGSFAISLAYVGTVMAMRGPVEGALPAWLRFWIGDGVGMVVTLPFLLMFSDGFRREEIVVLARRGEFLFQCLVLVISLLLVFLLLESARSEVFYLLFLPLIWISVRHGLAGTVPVMAIAQVGVVIGIISSHVSLLSVLELQVLLLALAVVGFFIAVSVDERQEISENLWRTLKLATAGEMAAAISHELNQPLTALNNYAQACRSIAEKTISPDDPLLRVLTLISNEAMRAGETLLRLRELFESGRLERTVCDLGFLLAEGVKRFRDAHPDVIFISSTPSEPVFTHIDKVQIALVLRNLLQNALESIRNAENGMEKHIKVNLSEEGGFARVDVIDSGPGVAMEHKEKIFELFYSEKTSGMGIGLSLSHMIVESHGGSLWVEPGVGGRFHFILPKPMPG